MALGIYKFFWDVGRMGEVSGVFLADSDVVADAVGKTASFGEILGKHSEIYGEIKDGDITLVTDDAKIVESIGGAVRSGYNPLSYIYSEEDDE